MKSFVLPLTLLLSSAIYGQRLTAMAAYDSATIFRDSAGSVSNSDHPSAIQLHQSLAILNNGLNYLSRSDVADLITGNLFLKFRRYNILNDIIHIYDELGERDSAVAAFEQMIGIGGYDIDNILKDSALADLQPEPHFRELVSGANTERMLWESGAFKTPYRDLLPLNEKIAGLSILWSQAKYNFVHFAHAGVDWNSLYLQYVDSVAETKTTAEYYRMLQKFYAALKDGHTNVYPPKELADNFYSRPPVRTELIEGRVFITEVFSDSLKRSGIIPGLEIVSIDGEHVLDYAREKVEPYQSSSTQQDMDVRKFTYGLISGPAKQPLTMTLRDKNSRTFDRAISRTGYTDVKSTPAFAYKNINGVGYLTINAFEDEHIKQEFDSLFSDLSTTKGLIIDLRKNGGGSGDIGIHILAALTDKPFKSAAYKFTQYNSFRGGADQWYAFPAADWLPNRKLYYSKPVVILISARTFSAAEDFVVAFDYMKRGKLIGQTTGGSTGQPLLFDLPGGGSARICAKDDTYPDGKKFIGIGIKPDIFVEKTVADLRAGKDAALVKALEVLQ